MRRLFIALLITASAATVHAQTRPIPFSFQPEPQHARTEHYPGVVRVTDHNTRYTIAYLPLLAPLPGSVPSTTSTIPTAFALNHVTFPYKKGQRPPRVLALETQRP